MAPIGEVSGQWWGVGGIVFIDSPNSPGDEIVCIAPSRATKAKFCSLYLKLTLSHNLTNPPDNITPIVAILWTYVGVLEVHYL